MNRSLSELARAIGARHIGADGEFRAATIDSRDVAPNALFFALPGIQTDGHRFVTDAIAAGAAGVVVSSEQPIPAPQLIVDDPAAALRSAGVFVRRQFVGPVIGVTGSNGKTTVKQMLAAVMAELGPVHATRGNLNNELGVPITLAGLAGLIDPVDRASAVIEMAAGGPGDIAELGRIVEPDVAVVTNAGRAHLERFGSVAAVAETKGAIYETLAPEGVAVINADDTYVSLWRDQAGGRHGVTFGLDTATADITARRIVAGADAQTTTFELVTPAGTASVQLPLCGRHNVLNALATAGVAHALGLLPHQIAAGLAHVECVAGRLECLGAGVGGAVIVDDSYNANPESLTGALAWLAKRPPPRWLVLGDMAELGAESARHHAEAGKTASRAGVERLWTVGELSRYAGSAFAGESAHYAQIEALTAALITSLESMSRPPTVLIKGSRSAGMERVVAAVGPAAIGGASTC